MRSTSPRLVLVTGASAGIGRALAETFAAEGHDLVLVARRAPLIRELAAQLTDRHGIRAVDLPIDLGTRRSAEELAVALRQRDLSVDILVNNAGVAESGAFRDMDGDALQRMLAINIAALTQLSRVFLPDMLERGWGRILNVASVAGFQPVPGLAAYAASKAYVLALTEAMTEELRGTGVRVTALCPGLTATDMVEQISGPMAVPKELTAMFTASPERVAREGYDACMRGETIRVPGVANRLGTFWTQLQPRWVVRTLGGVIGRQVLSDRWRR